MLTRDVFCQRLNLWKIFFPKLKILLIPVLQVDLIMFMDAPSCDRVKSECDLSCFCVRHLGQADLTDA